MPLTPLRFAVKMPTPEEVMDLYAHAPWARERRLPQVRRMLSHTTLCFTARQGRRLVGMARVVSDLSFRAAVYDVIVHPDCHRRGIGSALVKQVLSHPRLRTVDQVWLYTTDKQAFYERLGFRPYPGNMLVHKRRGPR
jgi:ribosomal protein S18 acetylase RimI-like enzyme